MILSQGGVRYVDIDDARRLMDAEGIGPVGDVATLEGQLARPQASFDGADLYPEMHQKAAVLLHGLATTQSLVDGNKRLAAACTAAFYRVNGYRFSADPVEFAHYVLDVAEKEIAVSDIALHLARWATDQVDALAPDYDD